MAKPHTDAAFADLEQDIASKFLPSLFGQKPPDPLREVIGLPIKHSGLALPNPVESAQLNHESSVLLTSHLTKALRDPAVEFDPVVHRDTMGEARKDLRERTDERLSATLDRCLDQLSAADSRTIRRGARTGAWLNTLPSTVNGTLLSAQEFRDALCTRYALTPTDLPTTCDGCGCCQFSVRHGLSCKKGGLVGLRHNEIKHEIGALCKQALSPSAVRDEPLIHSGRSSKDSAPAATAAVSHPTTDSNGKGEDLRGDLLLRGFWEGPTHCVVDLCVIDTDARSYRNKSPSKVLAEHEARKNGNISGLARSIAVILRLLPSRLMVSLVVKPISSFSVCPNCWRNAGTNPILWFVPTFALASA